MTSCVSKHNNCIELETRIRRLHMLRYTLIQVIVPYWRFHQFCRESLITSLATPYNAILFRNSGNSLQEVFCSFHLSRKPVRFLRVNMAWRLKSEQSISRGYFVLLSLQEDEVEKCCNLFSLGRCSALEIFDERSATFLSADFAILFISENWTCKMWVSSRLPECLNINTVFRFEWEHQQNL